MPNIVTWNLTVLKCEIIKPSKNNTMRQGEKQNDPFKNKKDKEARFGFALINALI